MPSVRRGKRESEISRRIKRANETPRLIVSVMANRSHLNLARDVKSTYRVSCNRAGAGVSGKVERAGGARAIVFAKE